MQGSIYDIVLDIRKHSEAYMKRQGFELTAEDHNSLYIQ